MSRLQGKAAIVLGAGAAGNIGQAIARRYAREGANVLVTGRRETPLRAFADEIGADWQLVDITKRDQVFAAARTAKEKFGQVDIGVNSTGWGLLKPTHETTEQELDDICAIQFKGPFFFIQSMLDVMDRGGSIIQISSVTADNIMLDNHAAYMGTKAAIDQIIRTIANDYGHRGIRANSILPGVTDSPMAKDVFASPAIAEAFTKEYPLGRMGIPEDIAAAAVWLAEDECFMTGQAVHVSGGLTLRRYPQFSELLQQTP